MLLRKTTWFWKGGLAAISFTIILSISGCSDAPSEENTVSETVIDVHAIPEESQEDAEEIINICIDLYEKAAEENKLADLETTRGIVNRLGEKGYPAVDSRNQVNMTEAEQVLEFCEKVDAQEEAEITILEVSYLGGFVKYYPDGIPKEKFENLIMEYLPITVEKIREYAAFDKENQTYFWARLGCFNYAPTFFGTSLPEVVDIKENDDETVTLTVEAVCDMVICDDAVITHELTVRFAEDGSFQYLGNEILNDGITDIPDYQYRVHKK